MFVENPMGTLISRKHLHIALFSSFVNVTAKKNIERGSGVDKKFDFLNRCSDDRLETADPKISSKRDRFAIHMIDSEVGWMTCE
jgi:hypothetical protein